MSTARMRSTISSSTTRTFVEDPGSDDMKDLTLSSKRDDATGHANCLIRKRHARPGPAGTGRVRSRSSTRFAAGTVVIDTAQTYLYYVLGDGKAIRYGIGVGRVGFTWGRQVE